MEPKGTDPRAKWQDDAALQMGVCVIAARLGLLAVIYPVVQMQLIARLTATEL